MAKKKTQQKPPRLSPHAKIGIVGGGLGGLGCALALRQLGGFTHVVVYEREEASQQQQSSQSPQLDQTNENHNLGKTSRPSLQRQGGGYGYGLTLTYNPRGPLAELGILDKLVEMDTPSRSHYLFETDGSIQGYFGNAFLPHRGHGQRGNLRVPRHDVRKVLLQELARVEKDQQLQLQLQLQQEEHNCTEGDFTKEDTAGTEDTGTEDTGRSKENINSIPTTLQWGKRLVKFVDHGALNHPQETKDNHEMSKAKSDYVTLYFDDGTCDNVNVLIGADGLRSVVRRQLVQQEQERLSGDRESQQLDQEQTTQALHVQSNGTHANHITIESNHNNSNTTENPPQPRQSINKDHSERSDLRYLGVMVILGITEPFFHPLLTERGFYTLDAKGGQRLFTMPFEAASKTTNTTTTSSTLDGASDEKRRGGRTMWQLSFPMPNQADAITLKQAGPRAMMDEALRRCQSWHEPVCEMMQCTPLDSIWGTGLMDVEPKRFHNSKVNKTSRVVLIGDAMHAMSPFKGQGANQALADGPHLTSWLLKAALPSALAGFEREQVLRSGPKVQASREAALALHCKEDEWNQKRDVQEKSPRDVIGCSCKNAGKIDQTPQPQPFAGVKQECVSEVLGELKRRGIGAHLGAELDEAVGRAIQAIGAGSCFQEERWQTSRELKGVL